MDVWGGNFVELEEDLSPLRSYAVWGRRDQAGRLLEKLLQWTLVDAETVVGIAESGEDALLVRLRLTSGEAGRFETLETVELGNRYERRFFTEGSPKLAAAQGMVYVVQVSKETTNIRVVGNREEVVATFPGGTDVMAATATAVGDCFVGLGVLGLVTVEGVVLVWRHQDRRYWLEDLTGRVRCRPRRSNALRLVPVVGPRTLGLLELVGEGVAGEQAAGLLHLERWTEEATHMVQDEKTEWLDSGWGAELERRSAEFHSGEEPGVPADVVLAKLRAELEEAGNEP